MFSVFLQAPCYLILKLFRHVSYSNAKMASKKVTFTLCRQEFRHNFIISSRVYTSFFTIYIKMINNIYVHNIIMYCESNRKYVMNSFSCNHSNIFSISEPHSNKPYLHSNIEITEIYQMSNINVMSVS